jgi:hypothetical protein
MSCGQAALRGVWHVLSVARTRFIAFGRKPSAWWRALGLVGVVAVFADALRVLLAPVFHSMSTFGFHDWDSHSAYRYVTVLSLKRYLEPPWWHPWLCGGFPAWAYVEGAPNFASLYLPLYLLLPIQVAERFEVLGGAVTGLVSAYLLAGRFTRSAAVRALVAVAYAINGRWALQAATGHTWHLQYGWLPLALLFFDISLDPGKRRFAIYAGMVLAIIVYEGGIYPLPHTALTLVLYATALALARWSVEPFLALMVASLSGVGFAAPKLFPMVDLMMRYPRKIDSTEAIDLGQLVTMMIDPDQSYLQAPISVPQWGWHEYGIYVGGWVVVAMLIGLVAAQGRKAVALKFSGLALSLLGMGAFHKCAPWTLLHQVPVFSSQHVPTRFLFPAILLLMLAFAAFFGNAFDRLLGRHGWMDVLLLIPVYMVAQNIVQVGRKSTEHSFFMEAPPIPGGGAFHQEYGPPYNYTPPDWTGATLLAMMANTGVIACYGVPDALVRGAIPRGKPEYRGEAYLAGPGARGEATITRWTPNTATVRYENAGPGTMLVYNMNYDPSWRANGEPAVDYDFVVATPVPRGSGEIKFTYYPRTLNWGLTVLAFTAFACFGLPRLIDRRRKRASGAVRPSPPASASA